MGPLAPTQRVEIENSFHLQNPFMRRHAPEENDRFSVCRRIDDCELEKRRLRKGVLIGGMMHSLWSDNAQEPALLSSELKISKVG